jgi:hypothetical protein
MGREEGGEVDGGRRAAEEEGGMIFVLDIMLLYR